MTQHGTNSGQGVLPGAAERVGAHASPPSQAGSGAPAGASEHEAVVLEPTDASPDIVAKLARGRIEESHVPSLDSAVAAWSDFRAEIAAVEADGDLSEAGRTKKLAPAYEALGRNVAKMTSYAAELDGQVKELQRQADDEDGPDVDLNEAERTLLLSQLPRMDRGFVGKRFVEIASKPKSEWSRSEGSLAWAATRLHRSLGVEVMDDLNFSAGFNALLGQSRYAKDIAINNDRAELMRRMAGEIKATASKSAVKHGATEAWEASLGLEPSTPRDRARWGVRR